MKSARSVADAFDSGAELVEVVSGRASTRTPTELAGRAPAGPRAPDLTLRLLRAGR